jgi:predicted RNA binding protein YcfA (HicA-like mRNA interferase family)
VKVKDVIKAIERDGWVLRNTTGDHRVYKKDGMVDNVTIPGKLSDEMTQGMVAQIRRKTGLKLR